jgi:hypothetical protein
MSFRINPDIPSHTMDALLEYVYYGRRGGDFLDAVISNDLKKAIAHADSANIRALPEIVRWMFNVAPEPCWGSPERMRVWKGTVT